MSTTTYCYDCGEDSYSEFDLGCDGGLVRIPALKQTQYNFDQADGPQTTNCDLPIGTQVEVCPGVKSQTGLIRGDVCFNESICAVLPEGGIGILRTYIKNSLGVVDGSVFHEAEIRLKCNTTVDNDKSAPAVNEYNIPFSILSYTKPVGF